MKKLLFFVFFLFSIQYIYANHTKGGYMYYEYLGQGSNSSKLRYRITLKLYTSCFLNSGQFDPSVNFTIFNASTNAQVSNNLVSYHDSVNIQNCTAQECHPCISPIPSICYKIITYQLTTDLDISTTGYIVSYQRCCRIAGINNIQTSNNVGDTWSVNIPGTAAAPGAEKNSSARFNQNDTAIICQGSPFTLNFGAFDLNGDSLTYQFTNAYNGGSTGSPTPNPASAPPYSTVPYSGGFSGQFPMGGSVTIDPKTGKVSGIAPAEGIYVVTVTVNEYKPGTNIKIAEVRKSLHVQVANCNTTSATLPAVTPLCNSYSNQFKNENNNNVQTWFWDFGVPSLTNDTSNVPEPFYTYPDTGTYVLKLVVNRGQPCSDSATSIVKVYPGFFPGFRVDGQCKNLPIFFTDTTKTTYGSVFPWSWDFGDPGVLSDTAHIPNPNYTYTAAGNYTVTFIVGNTKGCVDTVTRDVVVVDKADLTISRDTLICIIDTLQLSAFGNGSVLWSPNYNISSLTDPFPLVSPDIPTTYYVTLTDPFGCKSTDSVKINVKSFVTLNAGPDTTICQSDALILTPNSDGLYYQWTPPATLSNANIKNPVATPPAGTITYTVVSSIGKCTAQDQLTIKVVPYPNAKAGNDTAVCIGDNVQLTASGGLSYAWLPTAFLTNSHIPNPVAVAPKATIRYVVYVRDTLGCPKPATDTVLVTVYQPIPANAGPRDTSVVLDEPLQLLATGSTHYLWTPATWLNNANIPNPVALPRNNIEYVVKVSNDAGCFAMDTIRVKVYFVDPGFYVPTAFTPDGDGKNDVFRPVALGIRSLDKFMVFNRWGQLVFSTTSIGSGWDGRLGGKAQDAATYVWVAEGTDYKNRKIKKKGTVVLIR